MPLHKIKHASKATPVVTNTATSRVASASLEALLTSKVGLEAIQKAIAATTVPSQKPSIASIRTSLAGVLS